MQSKQSPNPSTALYSCATEMVQVARNNQTRETLDHYFPCRHPGGSPRQENRYGTSEIIVLGIVRNPSTVDRHHCKRREPDLRGLQLNV